MTVTKKCGSGSFENEFASVEQLDTIEQQAFDKAKEAKNTAWQSFRQEIDQELNQAVSLLLAVGQQSQQRAAVQPVAQKLKKKVHPLRLDAVKAVKQVLRLTKAEDTKARHQLLAWLQDYTQANQQRYNTYLYNQTPTSALAVKEILPTFNEDDKKVDGREVLNACFRPGLSLAIPVYLPSVKTSVRSVM